MSRFYVTTPIYYVNDVPHLGHAYTSVAADALRRYHALRGDETRMLTGTDEHGLKIERAAAERGMTPLAFADEISAKFREAWKPLLVESDDFIRTTEPRHEKMVQWLWQEVAKNGDLELGTYEDWYCVGCESFKTEKDLLPGNICPDHLKPVEKVREETYFFKLSRYADRLLEYYEEHPEFIQPESRRNEVISFVKGGLKDLSVSRTSFKWGIPVPGDPRHVIFVWFDALTNYFSALGGKDGEFSRFWGDGSHVLHLLAKDILRQHAIYWPAFLMSAGLPVPNQLFVHGYITVDGQKMGKSLRNAVKPENLAKELGADAVRYQLLRAISFGQDGDFDHKAMLERYNADLGKNLGNLLSRVLGLCIKNTDSKVPALGTLLPLDTELFEAAANAAKHAAGHWQSVQPHLALEASWALSSAANTYVDRAAPWTALKNGDTARVGTILATLLRVLESLSVLMWPVLPTKSAELRAQLGLAPLVPAIGVDLWPHALRDRAAGEALAPSTPLFPTYDDAAQKAILERLVPHLEEPAVAPKEEAPKAATHDVEAPPAPITYDQFATVELKVGVVLTCEKVPKKDKLLKLSVDLGEATPRQIVAGLALTFKPEALVGQRVIVVANLAPRDFGKGLVSHGMVLATGPSEALILATAPAEAPAGARLK